MCPMHARRSTCSRGRVFASTFSFWTVHLSLSFISLAQSTRRYTSRCTAASSAPFVAKLAFYEPYERRRARTRHRRLTHPSSRFSGPDTRAIMLALFPRTPCISTATARNQTARFNVSYEATTARRLAPAANVLPFTLAHLPYGCALFGTLAQHHRVPRHFPPCSTPRKSPGASSWALHTRLSPDLGLSCTHHGLYHDASCCGSHCTSCSTSRHISVCNASASDAENRIRRLTTRTRRIVLANTPR
ncbi:hypothetical protein PENSPDRAFT_168187 [Peniophora sp. CONT]|nr:hypothetical protein PENSPDRAFT_168187 [Peniophora sp. CONT]